jgi:hypothetical protein
MVTNTLKRQRSAPLDEHIKSAKTDRAKTGTK